MQVPTILIADDDADDRAMIEDAFQEAGAKGTRVFAEDGVQVLEYLHDNAAFPDGRAKSPKPDLILLDLNMPRMDGRAVLREVKSDPQLRRIPVIVLSTSKAGGDILGSYDLGVNSFIIKPSRFDDLVDVVRTINHMWIDLAQLPAG